MSVPYSNGRFSTFRNDNGNQIYISTASRIISGEELKQRNRLDGFARPSAGYHLGFVYATLP